VLQLSERLLALGYFFKQDIENQGMKEPMKIPI
jgi:hypothetical protein